MDVYDAVKYSYGKHIETTIAPTINIITLEMWGGTANPEPYLYHQRVRPYRIFHMNAGTDTCHTPDECRKVVAALNTKMTKWFGKKDCRYNVLIGGDLNVYEVRGIKEIPLLPNLYHNTYSKVSFLIGYLGDFEESSLPLPMWNLACHLTSFLAKNDVIRWDHIHHRLFDRPNIRTPKTKVSGDPISPPTGNKFFDLKNI